GAVGVGLAVEGGPGDVEAARELPIGTPQPRLVDRLALGVAQQVSRLLLVPAALAEQCHLDEYLVSVIDDAVPARLFDEPYGDFPVEGGELASLAGEAEPGCGGAPRRRRRGGV